MAVQISTDCITPPSFCDGAYGCGPDTHVAVVARIVPVFADPLEWDKHTHYPQLTIVRYNDDLYISKVPTVGTPPDGDCSDWVMYFSLEELKPLIEEIVLAMVQPIPDGDVIDIWDYHDIHKEQ